MPRPRQVLGELAFRPLRRDVMLDDDLNLDELRDVPLLQLSQKQRDAVFRNLQVKLDE